MKRTNRNEQVPISTFLAVKVRCRSNLDFLTVRPPRPVLRLSLWSTGWDVGFYLERSCGRYLETMFFFFNSECEAWCTFLPERRSIWKDVCLYGVAVCSQASHRKMGGSTSDDICFHDEHVPANCCFFFLTGSLLVCLSHTRARPPSYRRRWVGRYLTASPRSPSPDLEGKRVIVGRDRGL